MSLFHTELPEDSTFKWPWPNPNGHAEVCPVCGGGGKVIDPITDITEPTKTCHGCGGQGWITVK